MPVRTLRLIVLALVAAIAGGAATLIANDSGDPFAAPAFLRAPLGAEGADSTYAPTSGVAVELGHSGYVVQNPTGTVSLASKDVAGGDWDRFERGAVRTTPFGSETVVVTSSRTEQFLTVRKRQGERIWRWRLEAGSLKPELSVGGRVDLLAGRANSGFSIAPAAILDAKGRTITPAGTRWQLERKQGGTWLTLALDDANLPLPYVIDPATSYPDPLNLRNGTTGVTGSWDLGTTLGTVDLTTDNIPAQNITGWYAWNPGVSNTTRLATIPATIDGLGWTVDPVGGASGFPAGNWSFRVQTDIPNATFVAGAAVLTVGVWKGTVAGGVFTPTGTILAPTDDPAAQNLRPDVNLTTTTATYALPKFSLAAGETLFVDYWRHQTANINSGTATRRQLDFYVNDGNARINHPAADDIPPTHTLTVTEGTNPGGQFFDQASGRVYYNPAAAGDFTVTDALADAGSGPYSVVFPAITATGFTHAVNTDTAAPFTSTNYAWTTGSLAAPPASTLVGEDLALQTANATLTYVRDVTAPTGGALTVNSIAASAGGTQSYDNDGAFTIGTRTDYTETMGAAASGLATSTLTREDGTLLADVCSAYSAPATIVGNPAQSGLATGCYRYILTGTDNVGNTVSVTTVVKVDTSDPIATATAPTETVNPGNQFYVAGTDTHYYRAAASGSFTLNATASDVATLVTGVTFPNLSGFSGWTGTGNTDALSPYLSTTYSWVAAATAPGAVTVIATNSAGRTGNDTITIANDAAGPPTTVTTNEGANPGLQHFVNTGANAYTLYYRPTATGDSPSRGLPPTRPPERSTWRSRHW